MEEVQVPEPLWNEEKTNPYPFSLEAFVSGLGDGAIDELKSIPDLLVLGLSMFEPEQQAQIVEALLSIRPETISDMFGDKAKKYTGSRSVAWHEGGYDVVQLASLFYGGAALKGGKKAKETADGFMGVLNDLPQAVKTQMSTFTKTQREALLKDLGDSKELLEWMNEARRVKAWRVIENNPILRKKPENLENIGKWLDEGIEPQKLTDGITKSSSKQKLIDDLGLAKSKLHARVLIKDYDNIPGVVKGRFVSNSSSMADKADLPSGWASNLDLDADAMSTFTGKVEPLELKPGDKIYRVSDGYTGSGAYWTRTMPNGLEDVVGGTAVRPEWNNFEYLYEYTVPDGVTIKSWKGNAARQRVSDVGSNYHYLVAMNSY